MVHSWLAKLWLVGEGRSICYYIRLLNRLWLSIWTSIFIYPPWLSLAHICGNLMNFDRNACVGILAKIETQRPFPSWDSLRELNYWVRFSVSMDDQDQLNSNLVHQTIHDSSVDWYQHVPTDSIHHYKNISIYISNIAHSGAGVPPGSFLYSPSPGSDEMTRWHGKSLSQFGEDPPCYQWVNPLFRLGHGFNSYVTNYQRVHCTYTGQYRVLSSLTGWEIVIFHKTIDVGCFFASLEINRAPQDELSWVSTSPVFFFSRSMSMSWFLLFELRLV